MWRRPSRRGHLAQHRCGKADRSACGAKPSGGRTAALRARIHIHHFNLLNFASSLLCPPVGHAIAMCIVALRAAESTTVTPPLSSLPAFPKFQKFGSAYLSGTR